MIKMLENWKGQVEVNGEKYDDMQAFISSGKELTGQMRIILYPETYARVNEAESGEKQRVEEKSGEYRITVKKYMTEPASPSFDFMAKWNNNNPMPLRTMTGIVLQETRGMVKMKLHGDIWAEKICTCMCCGRKLTNPVSQYFGIGPECGGHNYVNPFDDEEQLREAVAEYKKKLRGITWEGWVIKSAIMEQEEVQ